QSLQSGPKAIAGGDFRMSQLRSFGRPVEQAPGHRAHSNERWQDDFEGGVGRFEPWSSAWRQRAMSKNSPRDAASAREYSQHYDAKIINAVLIRARQVSKRYWLP